MPELLNSVRELVLAKDSKTPITLKNLNTNTSQPITITNVQTADTKSAPVTVTFTTDGGSEQTIEVAKMGGILSPMNYEFQKLPSTEGDPTPPGGRRRKTKRRALRRKRTVKRLPKRR